MLFGGFQGKFSSLIQKKNSSKISCQTQLDLQMGLASMVRWNWKRAFWQQTHQIRSVNISVSSSWDGWGSLERAPESSGPSTPALWRASWRLYHRLVWKQHRWQPQGSAKGRANCPPHCWRWASLPPGHLHQAVYTRKARRIIKDSSHPSHSLLSLLPSGRRLRSIRSRTSRLRDSFFPQAIRLMNSQK